MSQKIRTRIAPSPTGDPHVGTAYMALFNYIYAKHYEGDFILRIEDTDQNRSRPEYEKAIIDSLKWAKLKWDEGVDVGGEHGPYRQSERTEIYRKYCNILLEKKLAYKCFATQDELKAMRAVLAQKGQRGGYDGRYRNLSAEEIAEKESQGVPYVVRLKVPLSGECTFIDGARGQITTPCADIDDQILMKSDGFPTYHLANVVDDHLMKINVVIRGEEWIASTPKHILLYEAFGWEPPKFIHMPLLLDTNGKKLSKRKNPTSIEYYKDQGYLQNAFVNFMTLMGYSMPGDKELYSLDEIIKSFDIKRIGTSGAIFDRKKLNWINQHYIINDVPVTNLWNEIQQWGLNEEFMQQLMPLAHTRIKTFADFFQLFDFFFLDYPTLSEKILCPKNLTTEASAMIIQTLIWILEEKQDWSRFGLESASQDLAKLFSVNHKKIIIPIIYAVLTGKLQGPPLYDSFQLLKKHRVRARLLHALQYLDSLSNKKLTILKAAYDKKECAHLIKVKAIS